MHFNHKFLAIDWGTTNRRVILVEGGRVTYLERDARGVTAVPSGQFPAEVADIRARLGNLPMLMAGMVGSTIGWREAAYVSAPSGLADIAANLTWIDERTAIVPGISYVGDGRVDVMRGEEVQLLGAIEAGMTPRDALLCHPGTHCKWVTTTDARVVHFATAMTGELFALLRGHGVLAPQLTGEVTPGDAFRAGIEEGRRGDLLASLFGIRAAKVLGLRDDADAASFASGLLIGADVAARLGDDGHDTIHILADPALARFYAIAIEASGKRAVQLDGQDAFVAGIIAIGAQIS